MSKIKNHVLVNGTKIGNAIVISNELISKGSCIPGTKSMRKISYYRGRQNDIERSII